MMINNNSEQKPYAIYIHINKVNRKKYIGITREPPNRRWRDGNGYRQNTHFYAAIQKYGWDGFYHIVAISGLTLDTACFLEKLFIRVYNTTNREFGYNATTGGERNYERTEDTKPYGKKNAMYGQVKDKNPFFNHTHSDDVLAIMKAKKYGGNNPMAKKVACVTTGEVFPSCREACEWCGVPRQNIHRCCAGERPSAGKHPDTGEKLKWRYVNSEI